MPKRPEVRLATRPLHFFWICDCSGSMSLNGKIQALNNAIREALPALKTIADENPNAQVLMHVLKFSQGSQWIVEEPTPLDQFVWSDLSADMPAGGTFSAEFKRRLDREGAKSGDVQISLLWHNYNDLDLHVVCPSGETIYFGHRKSDCGGELDVDMNVSPTSEEPVENVYWPTGQSPLGRYQVFVNHFKNHKRSGCQDPTAYQVQISCNGMTEQFEGTISHGQKNKVHEFDPGEFVNTAGNTDMGDAMLKLMEKLKIPPMPDRALPPVLLLISDGQPTDDFEAGLKQLMTQPWAKKAVRLAIGMGQDVEVEPLEKFIGNPEIKPLQANNPGALSRFIKLSSTSALKVSSNPVIDPQNASRSMVLDIPEVAISSSEDVW
ncbi:MAG: hypothetical protein ACO3EZ_10265 [Prochlorotrichaceae cyanobacterium]